MTTTATLAPASPGVEGAPAGPGSATSAPGSATSAPGSATVAPGSATAAPGALGAAFESLRAAQEAVAAMVADPNLYRSMTDDEAMTWNAGLAKLHQTTGTLCSISAGDIARRSSRELGYAGLAQREGFRTPEKLLQHTTGLTSREASRQIRLGTVLNDALATNTNTDTDAGTDTDAASGTPTRPWLMDAARQAAAGQISIDALESIRAGLGEPGPGVTEQLLRDAARGLLDLAATVDPDRLFRLARDARDELDEAGIAEREHAIHEQRAFRRVPRPNGLNRYIIDPDLESAALWDDLYDAATSPRRGGPRFVNPDDKAWAETIEKDTRPTEQYMHDSITQLLRIGIGADHGKIVGSRTPAVRVLVTEKALSTRTGHGRIEGQPIPVSISTVERYACTEGTVAIGFNEEGQALNLGREKRLFSAQQRVALAARDGGCRVVGCDRPVSYTEAHHINHWTRDRGETNIADGVLLCRYHHMLLHNNGWRVTRTGADYWLVPPKEIDPQQTPRPMPSKSAALTDLRREQARDRGARLAKQPDRPPIPPVDVGG